MRWRASCFRFPLGGDHESSSSQKIQVRKEMEFDKQKEDRVIKNLSHSSKKCNKKLDLMNKGKEEVDDDNDDSIRKLDQEFIVFSFRKDGSFDVVVESNSPKSESFSSVDEKHHVNSKLVIRKLDYGKGAEEQEQVKSQRKEKNISKSNHDTDQHDQVYMDTLEEGVAKENIDLSPSEERKNMIRSCQIEEIEDGRLVSNGSRNSNQSEGRGSFAFPKLAWDLVESPVKMPKSENLNQKKQKIRCVGFQCLRFR